MIKCVIIDKAFTPSEFEKYRNMLNPKTPEEKAQTRRDYEKRPERIEKKCEYAKRPEVIEKNRENAKKPERVDKARETKRLYDQTEKAIEAKKEWAINHLKKYCDCCHKEVNRKSYAKHTRTKIHIDNSTKA